VANPSGPYRSVPAGEGTSAGPPAGPRGAAPREPELLVDALQPARATHATATNANALLGIRVIDSSP
jgi:hypothetical protein